MLLMMTDVKLPLKYLNVTIISALKIRGLHTKEAFEIAHRLEFRQKILRKKYMTSQFKKANTSLNGKNLFLNTKYTHLIQ